MNNTVSKIAVSIALVILALVSFFPLAKSFPDSRLYDGAVQECTASIDEKTATVLRLTATATVTSAGISAIPGDTATPIAEKLADFSEYFLVILCVLYAEKYLLAIIPEGVFRLLVPLACAFFIAAALRSSRRWAVQGGRLLLVGLLMLCVIPVSLKLSDTIYDRYQDSINETIQSAEALTETTDELVGGPGPHRKDPRQDQGDHRQPHQPGGRNAQPLCGGGGGHDRDLLCDPDPGAAVLRVGHQTAHGRGPAGLRAPPPSQACGAGG